VEPVKSPPWLLVSPGLIADGAVVDLDPAEGRHAMGPLRLRSGDEVVLADGAGRTAAALLGIVGKTRVEAQVVAVDVEPQLRGDGVTLALAVIEPKAMDWAVQKAVEIGVRRLQPIVTDRTQASRRAVSGRMDHWHRIAAQALKQCRRPWAIEILDPRPVATIVAKYEAEGVLADPAGVTIDGLPKASGCVLAVGPEGGFSAAEDEMFTTRRWARLRLGAHILRSETAAIVGGAMMVARCDSVELSHE
jgi:16S rRNA (uracil1498-N3)-methyltransferase